MYQVIKRQIAIALEELSIKVNIADRSYPLTVERSEEEKVRKAARMINDKLKVLQQQFAISDRQDMLSMVALEIATECVGFKEGKFIEDNGLSDELRHIQELLKKVTL